jgi:hypothetical protein
LLYDFTAGSTHNDTDVPRHQSSGTGQIEAHIGIASHRLVARSLQTILDRLSRSTNLRILYPQSECRHADSQQDRHYGNAYHQLNQAEATLTAKD